MWKKASHWCVAATLTALSVSWVQAQEVRVLDTAKGQVELSGQPERVVVLDEGALDVTLSVGVSPVATLAVRGGTDVADYLQSYVQQPIDIVGTVREPNLESIFKLRPDLILAPATLPDTLYKKLVRIAPTVVPPENNVYEDWTKTARLYAQALDKEAELDEQLAQLNTEYEALASEWSQPYSVSVVRWNPQGPILMSGQLFTGQLIKKAGLSTLELADSFTNRPHSDTLSLENLIQVDADWLLLASINADGKQALEEARKQPAFQQLKAAQEGAVHVVDGQIWSSGYGPLAAKVILQDLQQLAKQQP